MTDSERQQILKMIDDGKISAEQGLTLMQALEGVPDDDQDLDESSIIDVIQPDAGSRESEPAHSDPEFDRKLNRLRMLWVVPLWVGVIVTITAAYWMYAALQSQGFGFWFYFAWLPFVIGVALTALAFSSRSSRWIYINVKQKPGESPQRIVVAFPLSVVSGIMNFVKFSVPDQQAGAFGEVMNALFKSTHSSEPLMVDVQEKDGEHVQIYIG